MFLFFDCFKNYFIPQVKGFLTQISRPLKALLILHNAPLHPREQMKLILIQILKFIFFTTELYGNIIAHGARFIIKCKGGVIEKDY